MSSPTNAQERDQSLALANELLNQAFLKMSKAKRLRDRSDKKVAEAMELSRRAGAIVRR